MAEDTELTEQELHDAIAEYAKTAGEVYDAVKKEATEIKADAQARQAASKHNRTGRAAKGYRTKDVTIDDLPGQKIIGPPVNSLLGTLKGSREQTRAWGNPVSIWHVATFFPLRDAWEASQ